MGLFSTLGTALGGPFGTVVGAGLDIGAGFIGGGREKRGIEDAVAAETQRLQESTEASEALRARNLARTDPFLGAGTRATTTLEDLISGGGRLTPTAAETFAKEEALEGIDRASAAGKRLFSGRRLEDFGTAAAQIGSRFRQQDIQNLQDLAGRGFGAAQVAQRGDVGVTGEQNRLRELLGNVSSAGILGKTGVDVANIGNISSGLGGLIESFKPQSNLAGLLPTNPTNVNFNPRL